MNRISDYFSDRFQPILGGRKYEDWKKDSLDLQTVTLKNKKLASELEEACRIKGGFLTYAEYLQIDQFGTYGYHAKHNYHGFTPAFQMWTDAVFTYLIKHKIHEVVEMGPGNANLAHNLFLLCEKHNFKFTWNAIEVSDTFRKKIIVKFSDKKFKKYLGKIVGKVEELPSFQKALVISSFCIDSIPPEIFINTSSKIAFPNAVIGVKIKDEVINEFILNEKQLKTKGMAMRNGHVNLNGTSFDISAWMLAPMQRAYITISGFKTLIDVIEKVAEPTVLVIDEVRTGTAILRADHILPPLYLNIKNRYRFNPKRGYQRAGELLYYFPFYLDSLLSLLTSVGFKDIESDIEPKFAAKLSHKTWSPTKLYRLFLCYAVIASDKKKSSQKITLTTPKE